MSLLLNLLSTTMAGSLMVGRFECLYSNIQTSWCTCMPVLHPVLTTPLIFDTEDFLVDFLWTPITSKLPCLLSIPSNSWQKFTILSGVSLAGMNRVIVIYILQVSGIPNSKTSFKSSSANFEFASPPGKRVSIDSILRVVPNSELQASQKVWAFYGTLNAFVSVGHESEK